MELTAPEVRTDVALLTPPRREGDESAALGSQASVGFLSHGGPLAVSCSTFETPTKTSPATRRRWSPARSLSQASQAASRASCRSRSRSHRSSSFPLGQPDPPTPEAIEATQNSQVIVVDDDPSQPGPGPMNLIDMGLSQDLWRPEDIKTQDKIWLWSQSVPPTADSISCTQFPRRYHIVSQTPPKVQRSEVVAAPAGEASVLAQHQALRYASPEESFGAAQGRDGESHMDLNLASYVVHVQPVAQVLGIMLTFSFQGVSAPRFEAAAAPRRPTSGMPTHRRSFFSGHECLAASALTLLFAQQSRRAKTARYAGGFTAALGEDDLLILEGASWCISPKHGVVSMNYKDS
eukprot:s4615_g3.t1